MLDFLPGHDVDSLKNVIAMESNHHYWFGKMDLWFTEPVVTTALAFASMIILILLGSRR